MEIRILGSLAVTREGQEREIASARVRTVLALLALPPGVPLPAAQLVEELWSGKPLGNARNALHANITRLRKLLESVTGRKGDEVLRTVSGGYLLDVPKNCVDGYRFLDLAERGAAKVQRHPAMAIELLEEALRLWRGPALLDVCDGARCRMEATHLNERRLSAREDLITAKLANGDQRGVVPELNLLTAQYPERERFSEQLMIALYRDGRQTEALDVFHHTRKRLASEMGLEPGRGMRQLYEAILVQDKVLG
ncbi:DNA-binding transcriptional activator of the SARP family [Lentzea albidocapillata subsp. violacea]|uniref:DNA-binding transcriptional activator of the SARP family n=1 Tax=Lentzea albidocapillata subsp. violacea TaxID=128104 RepID=A0A1G9JJP8_9PSEU|nr:AfsR/SARP family transcriptional regulator [Lentzea albidocapillata]SDL37512.1 DNA-binding transcriptional activator of the SARP family [Lentzea albidocapillata subsp. violacea]